MKVKRNVENWVNETRKKNNNNNRTLLWFGFQYICSLTFKIAVCLLYTRITSSSSQWSYLWEYYDHRSCVSFYATTTWISYTTPTSQGIFVAVQDVLLIRAKTERERRERERENLLKLIYLPITHDSLLCMGNLPCQFYSQPLIHGVINPPWPCRKSLIICF